MANDRLNHRRRAEKSNCKAEHSPAPVEELREAQENRREAAEAVREERERGREAAEQARTLAEHARAAADLERRDTLNSVDDMVRSLGATLEQMKLVEELRRALRDASDLHKLEWN